MGKRKITSINNIDDLIIAAEEAGLESIVEQAQDLKLLLNDLKKMGSDGIMTYADFFNLKEGEKYIFVCHQEEEYYLSEIEEKSELEIDNKRKRICFSTSSGDPTIELVDNLNSEMNKLYDLSDSDYQYSLYKLKTRKTKIKKILNNE